MESWITSWKVKSTEITRQVVVCHEGSGGGAEILQKAYGVVAVQMLQGIAIAESYHGGI